jgi:tRNA threonylcarbamoyl adenosine modification protein (Sua5/YciO/YrdC/YwlC family)
VTEDPRPDDVEDHESAVDPDESPFEDAGGPDDVEHKDEASADEASADEASADEDDDLVEDDDWIDEDDEQVIFSTQDPAARQAGFAEAKIALGRSALIVMPTDTVYGLVADAFDPTAVRRLFRAKGRSRRMPIPVLIGSIDTLRALATNVSPDTRELARSFWPGALTLICRQQPSLSWDLGDSRGTVALRMPDHPDAIDLLQDHGPLAVTSANLTGEPPATTAQQAYESLGESVDVYLDAGPTPGSVPSTIIDATGDDLVVVRQGVITLEQLREVIPDVVAEPEQD